MQLVDQVSEAEDRIGADHSVAGRGLFPNLTCRWRRRPCSRPAPFHFAAGIGVWSPPNRGWENFPAMSTSAPLGSPVSAEYDPMRTAASGWSAPRRGSWRIQWAAPTNCRLRWPTGRLRSKDPQTSEAFGYIAAGLELFTPPTCIDLGQDCLPRIVTFLNAAQTSSMAVLPLPSRKTAPTVTAASHLTSA